MGRYTFVCWRAVFRSHLEIGNRMSESFITKGLG